MRLGGSLIRTLSPSDSRPRVAIFVTASSLGGPIGPRVEVLDLLMVSRGNKGIYYIGIIQGLLSIIPC